MLSGLKKTKRVNMKSNEDLTSRLRQALELLERGQVTKGIEVLNAIGDFANKTEEQVKLLESIDIALSI